MSGSFKTFKGLLLLIAGRPSTFLLAKVTFLVLLERFGLAWYPNSVVEVSMMGHPD